MKLLRPNYGQVAWLSTGRPFNKCLRPSTSGKAFQQKYQDFGQVAKSFHAKVPINRPKHLKNINEEKFINYLPLSSSYFTLFSIIP